MTVAVLCPEGLLAAAIYQRVDASILEGYASLYLLSESQVEAGWLTRVLKRFLGYTGGNEVSTPPLINWYLKRLCRSILTTIGYIRLLEIGNLHLVSCTRSMLLWAVLPLRYKPAVKLA